MAHMFPSAQNHSLPNLAQNKGSGRKSLFLAKKVKLRHRSLRKHMPEVRRRLRKTTTYTLFFPKIRATIRAL